MALAFLDSILLVTPGYEFCSCKRVGIPSCEAAFSAGPLANPPTPMARSGLNSRMIFLALDMAFSITIGKRKLHIIPLSDFSRLIP